MPEPIQTSFPIVGPRALVPGPISYSNQKKATDQQILAAYAETNSVWRAAKALGMCGQSVHERLVKLGASRHTNLFTEEEKAHLIAVYDWYAEDGGVCDLAADMGRTRQFLSRQARKLGLTKRTRKRPYISEPTSIRAREWLKNNPHPRGMLGKTHSDKTKDEQSERSFVRWHSMGKAAQVEFTARSHRSWKAGYRNVGGRRIYFRSRWEANYGRYLEWLRTIGEIAKWEHEPKVFWFLEIKRGTRSYLPDFRITENNGDVAYHEVKGWMDPKSKTKIKRMAKYYPDVNLIVVNSKNYKALEKMISRMIVGWEHAGG